MAAAPVPAAAPGAAPPAPGRRPAGLWLAFSAPFAAYAGVYALAFLSTGEVSVEQALLGAVANVVPHAALGLGVVALCRRRPLPVPSASTPRDWLPLAGFLAAHAAYGLLYALAGALLAVKAFALVRWLETGVADARVDLRILGWQVFEGFMVYAALASATYALEAIDRLRREQARAAEAAALKVRAELHALRAQLDPHFLFNTLHSLLVLVRADPGRAEDALERLGDLLRYVLEANRGAGEEVALAEEWRFVEDYLALEKLRLGSRLELETRASPAALAAAVPPFTLQPLVENAVRHAIAPRAAGGKITIDAAVAGGELSLTVADLVAPLPAAEGTAGAEGAGGTEGAGGARGGRRAGNGLGLSLVRRRLEMSYGASARLELSPGAGGFTARVSLPLKVAARGPS